MQVATDGPSSSRALLSIRAEAGAHFKPSRRAAAFQLERELTAFCGLSIPHAPMAPPLRAPSWRTSRPQSRPLPPPRGQNAHPLCVFCFKRRSRKPVSLCRSRKSGSLRIRRKSEIFVLMPPTKYSYSARAIARWPARGPNRSRSAWPAADRNRSERSSLRTSRCRAGSPGRGQQQQRDLARAREEIVVGILGVDAALDGMAAQRFTSSCLNGSGSPAAMRICRWTRSRPVTNSVTGCSTCRRVFISRK